MKVHEYRTKALFAEYGIPIPQGRVVASPAEASAAAQELGGRAVLKAQVLAGGRSKGGGIRLVQSPEEAEAVATQLMGKRLITPQTGPEGVLVQYLLVEEAVDVHRELYLGLVVDSSRGLPVMMASPDGGVDVEEVATLTPERVFSAAIDPVAGFRAYQSRHLTSGLELSGNLAQEAVTVMGNLYNLLWAKDCSLVEINPLAVTSDDRLVALDAKLSLDENALFRHPELAALLDREEEDPLEIQARDRGINQYIRLEGNIGCIVNGAGLAMATMDMIRKVGGEPANFLDVGGGNDPDRIVSALGILASDPRVKAVLVHIFGGITRTDLVAQAVVKGKRELGLDLPIVVRLAGAGAEEARTIIEESHLGIISTVSLSQAAETAVAVAKGTAP